MDTGTVAEIAKDTQFYSVCITDLVDNRRNNIVGGWFLCYSSLDEENGE